MNKLCLIILDGYGVAHTFDSDENKRAFLGSLLTNQKQEKIEIDSIIKGKGEPFDSVATSTDSDFRALFNKYPYTLLNASSYFVGLPFGQMGNSEVGHLNIGAGKVVKQDLIRINDEIETGEFEKRLSAIKVESGKKLHLMCLVSNGCVHSNIAHLFACIDYFGNKSVKVCVHFISDGRDTDPHSGVKFAEKLNEKICKSGYKNVIIASLSGRYFAMDREKNFDRTEEYFDVITQNADDDLSIENVFNVNYDSGITDEFIEPVALSCGGAIEANDTVFMLNFRADRMRQIAKMFIDHKELNLQLYSMTSYSDDFAGFVNVIYSPEKIEHNLSSVISSYGLKQLKVAEQSKYAHVTYFLNGGIETPYKGEDRVLVPMADVKTFDLKPEMSASGVYENVKAGMDKGYDFICVNFANCDMVGHTGVLKASQIAVETVTHYASNLVDYAKEKGYIVAITADHGNCEIMEVDGNPHTAHTNNKVPFLIANANKEINLKPNGSLCNIMPTILELMGIEDEK